MTNYKEIDGIQVDTKIFTVKFCCDYEKCRGACCYQDIPDVDLNGGALSDYEAANILLYRKNFPPYVIRRTNKFQKNNR